MEYKLAQTTIDFIANLEKYRDWMEAERRAMTDQAFMQKYSIQYKILMQYMWPLDKPYIPRPSKVILDPDIINKMRLAMTDIAIRDYFHTSIENLVNQCWRRSEHWIPQVMDRRWPRTRKSIDKMLEKRKDNSRKKYAKNIELKTDNWVYPEPSEYELSWKKWAIEIWTNPIKTLYTKIK